MPLITPPLSKSAKLYQERRIPGDRETRRKIGPRSNFDRALWHRLPLQPPFPLVPILRKTVSDTAIGGHTQPWPHGEFTT